jgi:hypothetical protein
VERLSGERLLAFADEDFPGDARRGRERCRVDAAHAVEIRTLDAQRFLAEARAGGFIEAVVEARVTDGGGIHRRQLELRVEIFLDDQVERRVRRTPGG